MKIKTFDISTEKGIIEAENFQQELYKNCDNVSVKPTGFDKVIIAGI